MILAPAKRLALPCPRCGRFSAPVQRPRFAPHWRRGVRSQNMGRVLTRGGRVVTRAGKIVTVATGTAGDCECCGLRQLILCDDDSESNVWIAASELDPSVLSVLYEDDCYYLNPPAPPGEGATIITAIDIEDTFTVLCDCDDGCDCNYDLVVTVTADMEPASNGIYDLVYRSGCGDAATWDTDDYDPERPDDPYTASLRFEDSDSIWRFFVRKESGSPDFANGNAPGSPPVYCPDDSGTAIVDANWPAGVDVTAA